MAARLTGTVGGVAPTPASTNRPHVVAVVGATATGKSRLGVALARALGGEVVNADAMALYIGMDVGTAKPSAAEREGVPHHLLDLWPVTRTATVADYQAIARSCVEELLARGVTPVVVGGSGLYVRALLDEMDFPGTDPEVRAGLEIELAAIGESALRARLAEVDPLAATMITPGNGRRVVRALEVIALTGAPYTASLPNYDRPHFDAVHVGLRLPPAALAERIDARVARMWSAGLVDEVRALEHVGLRAGVTASRALGYAQLLAAFDGHYSLDEAREQTRLLTRRFARRQQSWFCRDPRIGWVSAEGPLEAQLATALAHRADPGSAGNGP